MLPQRHWHNNFSLDHASLSQSIHWVLAGSQSLIDPVVMLPTLSSDVGLSHISRPISGTPPDPSPWNLSRQRGNQHSLPLLVLVPLYSSDFYSKRRDNVGFPGMVFNHGIDRLKQPQSHPPCLHPGKHWLVYNAVRVWWSIKITTPPGQPST